MIDLSKIEKYMTKTNYNGLIWIYPLLAFYFIQFVAGLFGFDIEIELSKKIGQSILFAYLLMDNIILHAYLDNKIKNSNIDK